MVLLHLRVGLSLDVIQKCDYGVTLFRVGLSLYVIQKRDYGVTSPSSWSKSKCICNPETGITGIGRP